MPLEGSDELLVNRSGTTYTLEQQNLMAEIQNNDLLLVNRSGSTYTATGAELVDSVTKDLGIVLTFDPGVPYIGNPIECIPIPIGGVEPENGFVFTFQWFTADDPLGTANKQNLLGENSSTYNPTQAQQGKYLGCRAQTTDARGQIASDEDVSGIIDYPPVTEPPVVNSVVLTQDQVNDKRFAGNSFTTTIDVTNRQNKTFLEAQVVGALSLEVSTDLITNEDNDGISPINLTLNSAINLGNGRFEVGDVVTANAEYSPATSDIISYNNPANTTTAYTLDTQGQVINLSSFSDTSVLKISMVENGGAGSTGSQGFDDRPPQGGGAGGKGGSIIFRTLTVGEFKAAYGNTFTYDGTNNFEGEVLVEGANGGVTITAGNTGSTPGSSTPGDSINESSLATLNAEYPGLIWTSGTPGNGGSGGSHGAGGGGGGAAGVSIAIDSANDPTGGGLTIPALPKAQDGVYRGGLDGPVGACGGRIGYGGSGFGAGGGGGGAGSNCSGQSGLPSDGGAGADGIAIVYMVETPPTLVEFEDATDLNKLQEGDVVTTGSYLKDTVPIENGTHINLWDGDLNTTADIIWRDYWRPGPDGLQNNSEVSWQPKENSVPLSVTKFEVYVAELSGGDDNAGVNFTYNNASGDQTTVVRSRNVVGRPLVNDWTVLYDNPAEPVTPWTFNTAGGGSTPECVLRVAAIRINGEIAVDYAATIVDVDADNNQLSLVPFTTFEADSSNRNDWSSTVVDDHPQQGNEGPGAFAFDANFSTQWLAGDGDISIWTYDGNDLTGTIRIYLRGYADSTSYGYFKVNGVTQVPSTGSAHWYTVTGVTDALTSIEITRNNGTATGTQIYAIEVDGRLLVDNGIDLGPRSLNTLTPKKGEGTISAINSNVVRIDPFVDNCFVTGQYLLHKDPKAIQVIPESSVISVFDLPTDTVVFASAEGLYNFGEDDVVTMVDANGDPATANIETDTVTSKTISESSSVLAFSSDLNFNSLYATDVIKSDTEYTPDSGAISAVTQGTSTYIITDNQNPIDLTSYNSTDEIHIFVIDAGDSGGNGGVANCGNGAGGNSGRGGDGGKAYYGKKKIIDIGNVFTPNASNNFQGDQIMTDETKGKGGRGQGVGQSYGESYYQDGQPGFEYTADLSYLNDIYKGFTFQPGVGGSYTPNGGHWWSGSGGGGGGGLDLLFDQTQYDGLNNITVPVAPNASSASGASGEGPAYAGGGGRGWGAGGGGGGGVKCNGTPGIGGAGARGVTLIKISSPTVLSCATNQDFHGFEDGDEINQSDASATGIVSGKDFTNNELYLSSYTGTWKSDGSTRALGIARFAEGTIASKTDALKQIELTPITGAWPAGSKGTISKAGTGVVGSVDQENSSITLKSSNSQWVPGYYMKGEQKNAVEMRGYLTFDADGNNVDLSHFPQDGVLMNQLESPKITFPTTFSTGEGVDTDLPYPTYLETYVTVSNNFGEAPRTASNQLFPNWTLRPFIAPATYRVMEQEFGEFCYWACSSDYRSAIKTIQDAEHTVQELRARAETMATDFLNEDDVY